MPRSALKSTRTVEGVLRDIDLLAVTASKEIRSSYRVSRRPEGPVRSYYINDTLLLRRSTKRAIYVAIVVSK